ncbi:MAG: hypothetical protein ABF306_01710 [Nocardioides marinisabuli]|uniref:hypothetical protein n=1 Tax=Nocardioides marinisabuli TaxID=419476 RepID=UPI00321971F1
MQILSRTAVTLIALTLTLAGCGNQAAPDSPAGAGSSSTARPADVKLDETSDPPWPAPADVPSRVAAAGLDLGPMGTAEHYHPRLSISIDGQQVPVIPNIGVDPSTGTMSAVHTHEGDGTIHVEADTVGEKFTLGQLFTQWGVALTPTQIGGASAAPGEKVTVTSNGRPVLGNPADLQLQPDQQIELSLP